MKFNTKTINRIDYVIILILIIILSIKLGVKADYTNIKSSKNITPDQEQAFDHNQCQYPTRTTNPVNGCDNSDPCDPENTKDADGSCKTVDTPKENNNSVSTVETIEFIGK